MRIRFLTIPLPFEHAFFPPVFTPSTTIDWRSFKARMFKGLLVKHQSFFFLSTCLSCACRSLIFPIDFYLPRLVFTGQSSLFLKPFFFPGSTLSPPFQDVFPVLSPS